MMADRSYTAYGVNGVAVTSFLGLFKEIKRKNALKRVWRDN
jgi:hypothetical protein